MAKITRLDREAAAKACDITPPAVWYEEGGPYETGFDIEGGVDVEDVAQAIADAREDARAPLVRAITANVVVLATSRHYLHAVGAGWICSEGTVNEACRSLAAALSDDERAALKDSHAARQAT